MQKKIKVLIVEDSPIKMMILRHILESDNDIEIIGNAVDSFSALELLNKVKPDIITMDIDIPGGLNGFELTKVIMNSNPLPIVVISSIRNEKNKNEIQNAMTQSGALCFIDSPPGPWNQSFDDAAKNIIRTIKLNCSAEAHKNENSTKLTTILSGNIRRFRDKKIIVIGISTGGPVILMNMLSRLSESFKTPLVIAQHISEGFDEILVNHLNSRLKVQAKICQNHERINEGNIYFVPAGKITEISGDEFIVMAPPKDFFGHLPPISSLFSSITHYDPKNVVAVIMSGMGSDGVNELKIMRDKGVATIAQDKKTSIVYGMPKVAAEKDAAKYIMSPEEIADFLISFDKK